MSGDGHAYKCPHHGLDMPFDLERNWYACPKHDECGNTVTPELEAMVRAEVLR